MEWWERFCDGVLSGDASGWNSETLWTMFEEDEERSKSHALPLEVVEAQAERIGVPLMIRGADGVAMRNSF